MQVRRPYKNQNGDIKKRERMVEAKASMIELASVNREMISPVRRVAKKDIGSSKIWRNIG